MPTPLYNAQNNYMIPFLWMHGEDEARLRELIAAIDDSHIGALCVESRPHPDFLGPKWWHDMDIVLDECKKRKIDVWILDDEHFPTGYAAGRAAGSEHRVQFLHERHVDIAGPQTGTSILLNHPTGSFRASSPEPLVAVVAARRIPGKNMDHSTFINFTPDPVMDCIDLTDKIDGDVVYWDVPEGLWRIFTITAQYSAGEGRRDVYINPLTTQGTDILLSAVHESHYERYADEFGKTIKGFFSDEPTLSGGHGYHSMIGREPNQTPPFSKDVLPLMSETLGMDARGMLPALWCDIGEVTPRVRFAYMDAVTKLYGKNFCQRVGDWCRAHDVEYIGHVIEENNAHGRIGNGTGHYFRALWGQDMAGIDIVLNGIIPGIKGASHAQNSYEFEADDDFFYYCLAQMATSLAHIDPKKRGRAMCEIFGAYGWQEGLMEMKWLADFMMSRGINYYVPHAFTPKDFPDPDCPPHFYAMGENPQFRYFGLLMRYMNRVCDVISGGKSTAQIGVLYHAEAEWASSNRMLLQEMTKRLTQAQMECDILPADALADASMNNGAFVINGYAYHALIVPQAQYLPAATIQTLGRAARNGVRIVFVDSLPTESSTTPLDIANELACCTVASADDIPAMLADLSLIHSADFQPDLKTFPYVRDGRTCILLFNENIRTSVRTQLTLDYRGAVVLYDPWLDEYLTTDAVCKDEQTVVSIDVPPHALYILVLGEVDAPLVTKKPLPTREIPIDGYTVSIATAKEYPSFTPCPTITRPTNLNRPDALPRFSGTIRYEASFTGVKGTHTMLDLGRVGETAQVFVNGVDAGVRICPPYEFDLSGLVRDGSNALVIEVTNTLVYRMHDAFSCFRAIVPSGLVGPVTLLSDI